MPWDRFTVSADVDDPHAVLVRSANMHDMDISESLLAVGRAGSGTNNIPVARMSERGIPVFNAPGANANAVKELVVAGMLLAARNIDDALKYLDTLNPDDPELEHKVEAGKKAFAGYELAGQTLGIVGLGKIGCLVADAAIKLEHPVQVVRMVKRVRGWCPDLTIVARARDAGEGDGGVEQCGLVVVLASYCPQGRDVLGEARAAPADSRR